MAVLIRTRRLVNPSRKAPARKRAKSYFQAYLKGKKLVAKKKKNPAKKLSLAQKLHFGTARQRAAARLKLANPSRRRTKKAFKKHMSTAGNFRGTSKRKLTTAHKDGTYTFHTKRSKAKDRPKRRKNVGEIVSISLAGLNPGKRRKKTVAKRRARRKNYGTVIGRSFSHTKVGKRRKKNPGVRRRRRASAHRHVTHRRRRANPLYRLRRVRRHRNPGIGGVTTGVIGKAFAVIAGAIGSKYVTQLALGGNNTGYMGYGANLVASIGLGWAAGKVFKSKDIGTSVMIGGIAGLALRVLQDMTSIGQYVNLSLAGAGKGGDLGLGIIENSSFPVPQVAAPGSMTSFLTPRNTRDYVSSQMAQAAQMASTAKPGMGRMMGGRAPRRAIM